MRYVAPQFRNGRIGHQLTTVWRARLTAELFGLQYAHVPFASTARDDTAGPASDTGAWNDFLGLGRGEIDLATVASSVGYVTYRPPPRIETIPDCFSYAETWRLLDAVPDNHVLLYDDLALMDYRQVATWQAQGLVTAASVAAVPSWFQRQLRESPAYLTTPRDTPGAYHMAAYRRTPLAGEQLPALHMRAPVSWFNAVLQQVRARYPHVRAVLYTQQLVGDEAQLDAAWDVRPVPDTYPATLVAFKDLVEADLAVTSSGASSLMIQLYRHGQRPTVTYDPAWAAFPGLTLDDIERWLP